MNRRRLNHIANMVILAVLLLLLLTPQWPAFQDPEYQLHAITARHQFDFLEWELKAFWKKGEAILANGHTFLPPEARKQTVLDYLALMGQVQQKEAEINRLYVDPKIDNPDLISRPLRAELAQMRTELAALQPAAEAIVQDQVAAALASEGFEILGQAWPPVMMHMTPLPSVLIVSRRDRIERIDQVSLANGLSVAMHEDVETAVFNTLDRSALVVPIGGLGTYPAMIMETANINWLAEVTAHEWAHHWLTLRPLGARYGADPQMRIINETVASMIDEEIRDIVIERFYPEFAPPPPPDNPPPRSEQNRNDPPPFDYRAEMEKTRIRTDELLAAGKIEAAEAYMEERRVFFVANGFLIRKLNQAYFAFYGAYASQPGATGNDPIGPVLREIRAHSPSLRVFMDRVATITSYQELVDLYIEVRKQ